MACGEGNPVSNDEKPPEIRDGTTVPKEEARDLAWFSFFIGATTGFIAASALWAYAS